ncbi:hypothetical protein DL764_006502 [Monosporascus ibericus]|uniref:Uncharacterized protein n=1 Tax=Monosporascus ibericus TaxID=155417 RepID=A0A4V1XA24_9PEZI|nr:hypothetical protein DL764_006502 [Monosporascus ibericus]
MPKAAIREALKMRKTVQEALPSLHKNVGLEAGESAPRESTTSVTDGQGGVPFSGTSAMRAGEAEFENGADRGLPSRAHRPPKPAEKRGRR